MGRLSGRKGAGEDIETIFHAVQRFQPVFSVSTVHTAQVSVSGTSLRCSSCGGGEQLEPEID